MNTKTMAANKQELSVIQQALEMPEVLSTILTWIHLDDNSSYSYEIEYDPDAPEDPVKHQWLYGYGTYGRQGVLIRCGLVNKLWYIEVMPLLWSTPPLGSLWSATLFKVFANIDPPRRQFYANFVKKAELETLDSNDVAKWEIVFDGLKFPRLESLELRLNGPYVPKIEGHCMKSLEVDPPFEMFPDGTRCYERTQDEMWAVLDQIAVCSLVLALVNAIGRD